jgi:molybdate transport system substrate-binding protein
MNTNISRTILMLATLAFLTLASCSRQQHKKAKQEQSMTVFCGSASKPAMEKIARLFEKETNIKVNLIFGGSGTLLSQIELSKQGEIYVPGSPDYMVIGENKKLLIEDSDRIVSYLVPAIITPKGNPANIQSLEDLTKPGTRVGIGNPETVCLGLYSIELLEKNGMMEKVLGNVVTFGASCSKTANLVAMNQLDAILGWRVFHHWNQERMEVVSISPEKIPRISYIPISIPIHTKDIALSNRFIDFVLSPKGQAVYKQLGYIVQEKAAKSFAPDATIGGKYTLPSTYFDIIKKQWQNK